MSDFKLEIKVGSISFSGEGTGEWLSEQLDKVLAKIPELVTVASADNLGKGDKAVNPSGGAGTQTGQASATLAAFLKATNAGGSHPRKFLATAVWLHDAGHKNRLTTADITEALSKHNQGKLTNPAINLTRNAEKGFCVREGKQFYVSTEGRDSLK